MDTVQAIFTQLGVNESLLPQFIGVCLVFILAKFLFLNKLQAVLEQREEKTVKLESSADSTLEQVQTLVKEYNTKITHANKEAMDKMVSLKGEVVRKLDKKFKESEAEINKYVEDSNNSFLAQAKEQEAKLMSQADSLAGDLVNKIIQ